MLPPVAFRYDYGMLREARYYIEGMDLVQH